MSVDKKQFSMTADMFADMLDGKVEHGPSKNQELRDEIVEFLKKRVADKDAIYRNVGKKLGYKSDSHILSVAKKLAEEKKIAGVKGPSPNAPWNFSAMEQFKDRFGLYDLGERKEE